METLQIKQSLIVVRLIVIAEANNNTKSFVYRGGPNIIVGTGVVDVVIFVAPWFEWYTALSSLGPLKPFKLKKQF